MTAIHPKAHVILARDGKSAIIIRRGPSKTHCTIGWDRRTDVFTMGQWMRGRIYERRCDLSPDGRHFIYFAYNGKKSASWTAISRAPYLKAVGSANGDDCWNGGGLFHSNTTFWHNQRWHADPEEALSVGGFTRTAEFPFREGYGGECPGVYYIRLQRDGWTLVRTENKDELERTIFEKTLPKGWILEKTAHATWKSPPGKGCYYDAHRLVHAESGAVLECPDWEWADLDGDRLVWVENGILKASQLTGKGLRFTRELYDFHGMEFEAIAAPY